MTGRLVAFCGPAGAGKSTAAQALQDCGWGHEKFAGPLKSMLRAFYVNTGLSTADVDRRIEGDLKEVPDALLAGRTPRHAMQTLGTEWGRDCIGLNFWAAVAGARIANLLNHGLDIVVDDCRFANEADVIRALGGKIVLITGRQADIATAGHASEKREFTEDMRFDNLSRQVESFQRDIVYVFHETYAD